MDSVDHIVDFSLDFIYTLNPFFWQKEHTQSKSAPEWEKGLCFAKSFVSLGHNKTAAYCTSEQINRGILIWNEPYGSTMDTF